MPTHMRARRTLLGRRRGKAAFPVPGEEGSQNQEVLDAAYRSLKDGRAECVTVVEKKR